MPSSKGHVAAAETRAAIDALKPLLTAFLTNPFDPQAICDWFPALAEYCPLWALQERAYRKLASTDQKKLGLDPAWHLMAAVTEDEASDKQEFTLGGSILWSQPVIEPRFVGRDATSVVNRPMLVADASAFAPRYLLYAYRMTLIRRIDEIPLRDSLKPKSLQLPQHSKKIPDWNPDDPGALPDELYEDLEVVESLRDLVVSRDLATGQARKEANQRIRDFLRDIGVTSDSGRPSLPNSQQLTKDLARECRIWLPTEAACRETDVSGDALEKLEWWHCSNDPKMWAMRLAFPFLAQREIDFLRSSEYPNDDQLTAVLLIHGRLHEFLVLNTTADYALGTPAAGLLTLPDQNPLLL